MLVSGVFGFPIEVVANCAAEAILQYDQAASTNSCLKEIHIVDIQPGNIYTIIKAFTEKMVSQKPALGTGSPKAVVRDSPQYGVKPVNGTETPSPAPTGGTVDRPGTGKQPQGPKAGADKGKGLYPKLPGANEDVKINEDGKKGICFFCKKLKDKLTETFECGHSYCKMCYDKEYKDPMGKANCPQCPDKGSHSKK